MLMHGERSARPDPKIQTWRNNRAEPVSQDVSTNAPSPVLGSSDASSVYNVKELSAGPGRSLAGEI